jgi:hypothetical protein
VLHPDWTVESAEAVASAPVATPVEGNGGTSEKASPEPRGHFASLVCAITCGEFRILCDEFVSVLESHLPIEHEQEREGGMSSSSSSSSSGSGSGSTVSAPMEQSAQLQARSARLELMLATCFDLFDAILRLLVGDGKDDEGAWADLPASILIHFRSVGDVCLLSCLLVCLFDD